jgi:hypothetical protein
MGVSPNDDGVVTVDQIARSHVFSHMRAWVLDQRPENLRSMIVNMAAIPTYQGR